MTKKKKYSSFYEALKELQQQKSYSNIKIQCWNMSLISVFCYEPYQEKPLRELGYEFYFFPIVKEENDLFKTKSLCFERKEVINVS